MSGDDKSKKNIHGALRKQNIFFALEKENTKYFCFYISLLDVLNHAGGESLIFILFS